MQTNPLKDGLLTDHSAGVGPVSRALMRERAVEIAAMNGRFEHQVSKADWQQANQELTGKSDAEANDTALEAAPESERWDPVPGSAGHKTPTAASEDEDAEGRSDNERLVEEGVAGAEHDQMLLAARAAAKADKADRAGAGS